MTGHAGRSGETPEEKAKLKKEADEYAAKRVLVHMLEIKYNYNQLVEFEKHVNYFCNIGPGYYIDSVRPAKKVYKILTAEGQKIKDDFIQTIYEAISDSIDYSKYKDSVSIGDIYEIVYFKETFLDEYKEEIIKYNDGILRFYIPENSELYKLLQQ